MQNSGFAGRGGDKEGVESLEGPGCGRGGGGTAGGGFGGGEAALAVAVLPKEAQGAFVLAAEHDLVTLQELERIGFVGEGAEGLGLDFAVGEAGADDVAGDEFLDQVGFYAADAPEAVLGVGHLHDEVHFGWALRVVLGDVGVAEGDEFFRGLIVEESRLGEEAVFDGVLRGTSLPFGRPGTGGFSGIGAAGGEFALGERTPRPDGCRGLTHGITSGAILAGGAGAFVWRAEK